MSKNIFNSVQYPKVGSNTFDLSHDVKMSFKMGRLYPSFVMDVLPGDRVRLSSETLLRFAPLISPVMHRVNVTTHYFFVPNRLIWPNWEKWITGDLEAEPPYMVVSNPFPFEPDVTSYPEGSVADYLGIPTENPNMANTKVNAMPLAAYRLIFHEYYRDQNLWPGEYLHLVDGENRTYAMMACLEPLQRSWMHDYFTAALPFAQKGDAVQLPLGEFGDVNVAFNFDNVLNVPLIRDDAAGYPVASANKPLRAGVAGDLEYTTDGATAFFDPNGTLKAETSSLQAEAADINTLRRAFKLQEWLERNARGGTRYIENIMAHFGVKSSDARLNRPEYLGGSFQKMVISEVLSTAETDVPVGQMAGHGISLGAGKEFTYRAEEHGWIIGLINVQPVTAYQQGIPRMYLREDRLDYYWPSFAHIGEQAVMNKEIFVDETGQDDTFGYVPRYAEYRYINSRVAGEMRTTLAHWHLGRIFDNAPALNVDFVLADPSTRIFAVQDGSDHIYGHIFNNVKAVRKIPKFGTPRF